MLPARPIPRSGPLLRLLLLILSVAPGDSNAFIDQLAVVPSSPNAGDRLALSIRFGECDLLSEYVATSIANNEVVVTVSGLTQYTGGFVCTNPLPATTSTFVFGNLSPGTWTVRLAVQNILAPNQTVTTPLSVSVTVQQQPPQGVPAMSAWACMLGVAATFAFAWKALDVAVV